MTITRYVTFICDHTGCGQESNAEWTVFAAQRTAREDGWKIGRVAEDPDLCPRHREDR